MQSADAERRNATAAPPVLGQAPGECFLDYAQDGIALVD
jgi:hypothetical protein